MASIKINLQVFRLDRFASARRSTQSLYGGGYSAT